MIKTKQEKSGACSYDPFIHGTTSSVFSLMSKTNFQLMPILKMIDDYQTAPMVGELTQGGYSILGHKLAKEEVIGAISFGNLKSGTYNLEKITTDYVSFQLPNKKKVQQDFRDELARSLPVGFSNFNLLLIYLTRARQLKIPLEELINHDELARLRQQIHATVQFYYFMQLLGTHIHPDPAAVARARALLPALTEDDIPDAVYSLLRLEEIVKKIIANNIDMKSICENPTQANLSKALAVLDLPKKATIKSGFACADKEIELPISQFFSLEKTAMNANKGKGYEQISFGYLALNGDSHGIHRVLEKFLQQYLNNDSFSAIATEVKQHIVVLEDRIRILDKLINAPEQQFGLPEDKHALLKENYPVILVSESSEIKPHLSENRSSAPLQVGNDIRVVATDTQKHREHLKKYFRLQKLDPVQVVLISDLKKAANAPSAKPLSIDSKQLRDMLAQTKKNKIGVHFYALYTLLDDLNDKRNHFRDKDANAFAALDKLLNQIDQEIENNFADGKKLTPDSIHRFCTKSTELILQQKEVLEKHRGIWGVLDCVLTVMASLIVFYPLVLMYQKQNNISHTFFNTDSGLKAKTTLATLNKIDKGAGDFPENDEDVKANPL